MNCRTFRRRLPDRLAGRLAPIDGRPMDRHRAVCGACDRAALSEEYLCVAWRASAALPVPNLWPRIAARLDDATARERRSRAIALRGRLALGTAFLVLGAIAFAGPSGQPDLTPSMPTPTAVMFPVPALLSGLSDVSRMDPAVDDPIGTTMKEEWRQINTARTGKGVAR